MHMGELGCKSTWDIERENGLATGELISPVDPEPIGVKIEYCAFTPEVGHFESTGALEPGMAG